MITLRPASVADSDRLWRWRNDPDARAASLDKNPVPWERHEEWFARTLASKDRIILIAEDEDGAPVGMVRFDREPDGAASVSINIAPDSRGSGVGKAVLAAALDAYASAHPERPLRALIRESNSASLRLFAGQGFKQESTAGGVLRLSRASAPNATDSS